MTNVECRMIKEQAARDSQGLKAGRTRNARRRSRCRGCPFCAPSGACLDTTIKSGRCGDWVFYLLHAKQFRHLWAKPRDPRTPKQRYWRARLSAASRKYSEALTDEQQNACIAAGAKRRSRPRLAQSGPLTGQQWWVQSQCAGKAEGAVRSAQTATKALQTKGISLPTWEAHRGAPVAPPWQHRRNKLPARKVEEGRKNAERRNQKGSLGARVMRPQIRAFTTSRGRLAPCRSHWQIVPCRNTLRAAFGVPFSMHSKCLRC